MISAQQLRCANHGPEPEDCFAWVIPLWQCGGNIALCGNCGNVWQCVCHWCQLPPPGVNNVAWQPRPLARPGTRQPHTGCSYVSSATTSAVSQWDGRVLEAAACLSHNFFLQIEYFQCQIYQNIIMGMGKNMLPPLTFRYRSPIPSNSNYLFSFIISIYCISSFPPRAAASCVSCVTSANYWLLFPWLSDIPIIRLLQWPPILRELAPLHSPGEKEGRWKIKISISKYNKHFIQY